MFYLRKPLPITPGTYRYEKERDNLFLRLTSGSAIYVEQVVRVRPYKKYLLSLSLRSTKPGSLIVFICEKTLQYSFRCSEVKLGIDSAGSWQQKQVEMETGAVGSDIGMTGWFSRRPVRFSLYNSGDDSVVDVDNVRLIDDSGHNILMNGDFSQGHDRWFFSADDHIPWQNWNHWVQIYFEQGWVGVASLLCLVVYTLVRLFYRVAKGDWFSSVPLASILGFFAAGIFGSLFDTPRMAMLFFLISFFSCHPKISEPSRLNRN